MVEEGIYIEEKKSTLGVAGTSKTIVFKSLWATRQVSDEAVVLQLLNDQGQPTGLTETIKPQELAQRFTFRPVKPETWAALKQKLLAVAPAANSPAKGPTRPAAPKKPAIKTPGNWWDL